MGPGPLTEEGSPHTLRRCSRACVAPRDRPIYLANHSLGRPLDATADDVAKASRVVCADGQRVGRVAGGNRRVSGAARALLGAPRADCVVPKTSAGQGLRAILNTFDAGVSARRRDAWRIRFARRDPARIRAARAHRADVGRGAWRRTLRDGGHPGSDRARVDLVVVSRGGVQHRSAARRRRRDRPARPMRPAGGAARRLPLARRAPGRRRGARRRLRHRRQLQVFARRAGRVFPVPSPRHLDGGCARSTSAGSPSATVSPTCVPIRRSSPPAATR